MNKIWLALFWWVLITSTCCAAPEVTGVTGTISAGESITISGSGFGAKSTAAPIAWYNFDACTTGQNVLTSCAWEDLGTDGTVVSVATDRYYGAAGKSSKVAYTGGEQFPEIGNYVTATDQIYVSFNFYYSFSSCGFMVFKWTRGGYGTPYSGVPRFYDTVFTTGDCATQETYDRGFVTSAGTTWDPNQSGTPQPLLQNPGAWRRQEYYYKLGTAGSSNGALQSWTNQTTNLNMTGVTRTAGESGRQIEWVMSPFDGNGSESAVTMAFWVDNYYLDDTLARVEICNANTKAGSSHCEIQIPSAWSASSATITVNRGSFGASDSAYLYVIDSTGSANSSGYAVTFGSGSNPVQSVTGCTISGGRLQ